MKTNRTGGLSPMVLNPAQAAVAQVFEYLENPTGSLYSGRWWGRDGVHAERWYFQCGRKDVKAYLGFSNPATLADCRLNIYIEDCGQHARWYVSQRASLETYFKAAERAIQVLSMELSANPLGVPPATEDAEYRELVN